MAAHFAARLSLLAFAAVSLSGAIAGDAFDGTIRTALAAGAVFLGLGWVLGDLARRAVEEQVESEFDRWKAEQLDRLSSLNELSETQAATPRGGGRTVNETSQTDRKDPARKDPTDPTDQKKQQEPRTGAAKAAPKPAGKPVAQRGRA